MTLFRLRLATKGPYATPFHADTLMGHLCWAAVRTGGQAGLDELLESARSGQPRVVISDGFPGDLLPMPLLPPIPIPSGDTATQRAHYIEEKARRKVKWVTREDFRRILHGGRLPTATQEEGGPSHEVAACLPKTRGTLKNTIDRNSGTTPVKEQGGGLYEFQETFQSEVSFYARVSEHYVDTLRLLLDYLAHTGYGKRKSVGYGALGAWSAVEFGGFGGPAASEADAFVSLSTFVPGRNDPADGYWSLLVKYGKLGEEFALSDVPFKRPLLMFRAGAVFRLGSGPLREHYGRIVEEISYLPRYTAAVVQYALALPVPLKLPDSKTGG